MVAIAVNRGQADTPASQVDTQTVQPGQAYPDVAANGEGWFDVGGFCKVVDVGDLSSMSATATSVPVFLPGPTTPDQWENYRSSSSATDGYGGRVTLTTCCRPQDNAGTLCADGTNPTAVSRAYGKLGETDQVTLTCTDSHGLPYTDTLALTCQGDNGPDGQASWSVTAESEVCSPDAWTTDCNATCQGGGAAASGTTTTYDSCGHVQSTNACSITCCTPSYSYSCNQSNGNYVRTDNTCGGGSVTVGTCRYQDTTTVKSCAGFGYHSYADGTCTIEYKDCVSDIWGCGSDTTCNDGCSTLSCSTQYIANETCDGVTTPAGQTCPVYQYNCTHGAYVAP